MFEILGASGCSRAQIQLTIELLTGWIRVLRSPDYEAGCRVVTLTVRATNYNIDIRDTPQTAVFLVPVVVLDVVCAVLAAVESGACLQPA
jgi:acyl-coenzyme A thioesterase PaaI-like protein